MKYFLFGLSVTLIAGCSMKQKGFNRGQLSKQLGVIEHQVTDEEIKEALAKKPNLPKPFKIAVFFKSSDDSSAHYSSPKNEWRWT